MINGQLNSPVNLKMPNICKQINGLQKSQPNWTNADLAGAKLYCKQRSYSNFSSFVITAVAIIFLIMGFQTFSKGTLEGTTAATGYSNSFSSDK